MLRTFVLLSLLYRAMASYGDELPATTNGISFLKNSINQVTPSYPPNSVKEGIGGLVAAEMQVDIRGNVSSVSVIESPSREIADSVKSALVKWRFNAPPKPLIGKLFFYFVIQNGRGLVLGAPEAVESGLKLVTVKSIVTK